MKKPRNYWQRFWMKFSRPNRFGGLFCAIAGCFEPPFYGKIPLSRLSNYGYCSLSARIKHPELKLNKGCFVGDEVTIFQDVEGGYIRLSENVHLHTGTILQTGSRGTITIGRGTSIQPRCQISAYKGSVNIGRRCEIAPNCAFYPYDHSPEFNDTSNRRLDLTSKGDIVIGDDVWLGFNVVVLSGVQIGNKATVGAGAVVTKHIPESSIAVGNPARIVKS